jgi:hypothetical protein
MALKGIRQVGQIDLTFACVNTSERGGILSMVSISGARLVEYTRNPANGKPLGIQMNDIEWVNYGFQTPPQIRREVGVPGELVGVGINGEFETDWIYLSGQIFPGSQAYVGPSGMITNIPDFGGHRIGYFRSELTIDPHIVVYAGLGFYREYMQPITHNVVHENNPADQILLATPGYARVCISEAAMTYGN